MKAFLGGGRAGPLRPQSHPHPTGPEAVGPTMAPAAPGQLPRDSRCTPAPPPLPGAPGLSEANSRQWRERIPLSGCPSGGELLQGN